MADDGSIGELIAPPHTPMTTEGELDLAPVEKQAAMFSGNGIAGAFVAGSTGEGYSLSLDERMALTHRWADVAGDDLKLLVHVGAQALPESKALAAHAAKVGADVIGVTPPCYFRPTLEMLVGWLAAVAEAAPEVPMYYYHIPVLTGVEVSVCELFQAAREKVPTLQGAKFTDEDLAEFALCTELDGGRYTMYWGRDQIMMAGMAVGAAGAVGSTYNYAAPLYLRIMDAVARGDMKAAREDQLRSIEMIKVLQAFAGVSAGKTMMKLIGLDLGPVRLPLKSHDAQTEAEIRRRLEAAGFFEYCCRVR